MSGLLIGVGAVALVAGAVMIGFGIPINEFSFGNTLIAAGTTAFVGGLIVIGLGLVLVQLQRIAEALASRTPIRSSRPVDMFDTGAEMRNSPPPARIPFPTRPKADLAARELHPMESDADRAAQPELPMGEPPVETAAPTLRNPDEPPVTVEDEVSLSPQDSTGTNGSAADQSDHDRAGRADRHDYRGRDDYAPPFGFPGSDTTEKRHSPMLDSDWQTPPPPPAIAPMRQPHTTYFDAMWPADSKPARNPASVEAKTAPKYEPAPHDEDPADAPAPVEEPRTVAILKSGVVDGMGYTLYVDGSIEAELPDGTLRFASINELRSHLEKNP
jgi:hypothetical protein